jgi:hypothetical protein
MLAVLRVAPLLPSPTLRAVAQGDARSGQESRLSDRTGKPGLGATDMSRAEPSHTQPVMYFYSSMQFLSGVDMVPQGRREAASEAVVGAAETTLAAA